MVCKNYQSFGSDLAYFAPWREQSPCSSISQRRIRAAQNLSYSSAVQRKISKVEFQNSNCFASHETPMKSYDEI